MCGWFHTRGTVELISLDWVGFLLFGMSGEVFLVVFCLYLLGFWVSSLVPFFVRDVRLVPYQRDWDTSAKKGFSPGTTVVASGSQRCALSFLLASSAHTWSQHPGCAQEPPEQHHMDGIHLLHPEGQLCTWYTRRHPGNQPIRGIYWATNLYSPDILCRSPHTPVFSGSLQRITSIDWLTKNLLSR